MALAITWSAEMLFCATSGLLTRLPVKNDAVAVTCPGTPAAQGEYYASGRENGKARFEKGDGWFICWSGRNWWISCDYYTCGNDTRTGEPPAAGPPVGQIALICGCT